MENPFVSNVIMMIGPVPISFEVVVTWGIMVVLCLVAWLSCRNFRMYPGRWQTAIELLVVGIDGQITEITGDKKRHFLPLIGTLFIFIAIANLVDLIPGLSAPTAVLETPAALAVIIFFSVHYVGICSQGFWQYLKSYAKPNLLLMPFTILSQITRTFSMMIRLFGNIMSGQFLIGLLLAFAGLLVPIPLMVLHVLISLIQAYIFATLATVFIAAAMADETRGD
tara:strand:- start:10224 stop:10895 length:672 start_codon:yes stop_codon:yes gene_type:complete